MYSELLRLLRKRNCGYKTLANGIQVILPLNTTRIDVNYYDINKLIQEIILPFEGNFVVTECYYVGYSVNKVETDKTSLRTLKGVNDLLEDIVLGETTLSISLKVNNTISILLYSR
jgi:hypothetical protein